MKIYKESLYTKLARELQEIEDRRDNNYRNYMNDEITLSIYVKQESILVLYSRNIQTKMNNLKIGLPENGVANYIDPQPGKGYSKGDNIIDI